MRFFVQSALLLLLLALTTVHCRSTKNYQKLSEYDDDSGDDNSDVDEYENSQEDEDEDKEEYDGEDEGEDEERFIRLLMSRGGPPVRRGLTQKEINDIVDRHNRLRAGEGASNMEVLRWSDQLASLGQQWADRCNFAHGQPPFNEQQVGYKHIGQNLFMSSDPKHSPAYGVQLWFDEKANYYYNSGSCSRVCGHYTQVVWAKTREVGCGWTNCSSISGMRYANVLVCNYGPPGNYPNQKPFKKGAPCTECDSGKFFCTNSLCDSSCSSAGSSSCKCAAKCGRCGSQTADCKCRCKSGWGGVACNEQCRDKNPYCGGNPGWPTSWCDSKHQFVLDDCPKMCKLCQAESGGERCSKRTLE